MILPYPKLGLNSALSFFNNRGILTIAIACQGSLWQRRTRLAFHERDIGAVHERIYI